MSFFAILTMDSITKETVDPIKTTVIGIISAIIVLYSLDPNATSYDINPFGEVNITLSDPLTISSSFLAFLIGIMFFFLFAKNSSDFY